MFLYYFFKFEVSKFFKFTFLCWQEFKNNQIYIFVPMKELCSKLSKFYYVLSMSSTQLLNISIKYVLIKNRVDVQKKMVRPKCKMVKHTVCCQ